MLNKQQKKDLVVRLTEELKSAKSIVLSSFQGVLTKDIQELRAQLRKDGIRHQVVKLSLLKRILRAIGVETKDFRISVPTAITYSREDEVLPARALQAFAKKNDNLKILAGVLDQRFLDTAAVKRLAALPGKPDLLGQLVGTIAGPLRGLAAVLSGNMRQLVSVLSKIKS